MTVKRLLKSCATPPVSWPTASSFCDWANCSRASLSSRRVSRRILSVRMRCAEPAARMRLGVAIPIMKMRISVEDSSRTLPANGLPATTVPQAAKPKRMSSGGGGIARTAAQRRPYRRQHRKNGERRRARDTGRQWAEGERAKRGRRRKDRGRFQSRTKFERSRKVRHPQDQGRRDHQQRGQIPQPPWEPHGGKSSPVDLFDPLPASRPSFDARADAGADGRGQYRDQHEFGDAGRRREDIAAPRPPIDQKAGRECFQGIARGDCGDGIGLIGPGGVGQVSGRKDGRHYPVTTQQDGGQSKCRRGPNQRRARVSRSELETKAHEDEIDRAHNQELDDIFQGASQGSQSRCLRMMAIVMLRPRLPIPENE